MLAQQLASFVDPRNKVAFKTKQNGTHVNIENCQWTNKVKQQNIDISTA
jgi:hypothetical protein